MVPMSYETPGALGRRLSGDFYVCAHCSAPIPLTSQRCSRCLRPVVPMEKTFVRPAPTLVERPFDPSDALVGTSLGGFVIERRIDGGGMGIVYKAVHRDIGKTVAIKVLRPEILNTPEHVERLLSEARAVNAIHHRGIVDIHDFGQLPDGRQYLVMEYIEGEPLDQLLARKGRLTPAEARPLLVEILEALAAVHGAGVVHRDLKPQTSSCSAI